MPTFSSRSLVELDTCDKRLQSLFRTVVRGFDCTILEGYRDPVRQWELLRQGRSKVAPPHSKHNQRPSLAVDVAPYPIDWNDSERFYAFGGYVMGMAAARGLDLRWGGDWDEDWSLHDQTFNDLAHFELMEN